MGDILFINTTAVPRGTRQVLIEIRSSQPSALAPGTRPREVSARWSPSRMDFRFPGERLGRGLGWLLVTGVIRGPMVKRASTVKQSVEREWNALAGNRRHPILLDVHGF